MNCRHCQASLSLSLVDLGTSPPSNSYLTAERLDAPERWYPLRVLVCSRCWLAQTADFVGREECFSSEYAYFSSSSTTWVEHARSYVEAQIARWNLGPESLVLELAANDGYLLQHFAKAGVPNYGVEPTESTAKAARAKGIDIVGGFFGETLAKRLRTGRGPVDLIAANNVLAHVPDINDFVKGISLLLKKQGVATIEFPHLLQLMENTYFDTIYHEHFSYLSLHAVKTIFADAGMTVFDLEELATHGGSLRVYLGTTEAGHPVSAAVRDFLKRERAAGLLDASGYSGFGTRVEKIKNAFLRFLLDAKQEGKSVAAYGAAAKGNTLLNYAGIRGDLISFVVDRSPGKRGKFLPGSRIPIVEEDHLRRERPDRIVIFPWNLRGEITDQLSYAREWGARFVVALPELEVF